MGHEFTNWSGSLRFTAAELAEPTTTEEVVQVVRRAAEQGRTVRPVGAGHSSTELARTEDVLMSMDGLRGLVDHDTEARRVRVLPGTRLSEANAAFADVGLAMENLGDVDFQAIVGALATGTHGSGRTLQNLSQMLVGGELVTGRGEVLRFGEDADGTPGPVPDEDLLRAARVSLGALGVLTSLTLRLVPAEDVHRRNWCTHIDWALEHYDELAATNRAFDMYWYPRSDRAQVRTVNPLGHEPTVIPPSDHVHDDQTGPSHEVIPNDRVLPFDEMEYMVPYDPELRCFREVRDRIKAVHRRDVAWRVLVRTVAEDDALISNCYGRPTMTIAILHNAGLPYGEYFADIEPILQAHGGRPHWGKKHTMTGTDLAPLLPEWERFREIRRELDPAGVFLNDHLRTLFEEDR